MDAYPNLSVDINPSINLAQSISFSKDNVGFNENLNDEVVDDPELFIWVEGGKEPVYHLAYKIELFVHSTDPQDDVPVHRWQVFVDAHNGEILEKFDEVRMATVEGHVSGPVKDEPYGVATDRGMPHVKIDVSGVGNTYTDVHENITDTTISISSHSLDPLLNVTSQDEAVFTYYVYASDEENEVPSDSSQFVLSSSSLSTINKDILPETFALHQNYPNPFNPITSIRYDLAEDGLVNITIYDMMGRIVKTLVNSSQTAGYKSMVWDTVDDRGHSVSAGLYIYSITAGNYRANKKMILLK